MARFLTYGCRQNYARKRQVPPPSDTTGWHKRLAHYGEEGHLAKTSKQGIISSAPAAQRIAEVSRLFPMVLVREDPRVQATLLAWLEPRWTGQNRPFVDTSKPAIPVSGLEAE
jgi:hypothetical protein